MKVSFGYSQYLGGHSDLGKKRNGNLILTDEGIGLGTFNPKHAFLSWTDVLSIDISGDTEAKSKVGAVLVFGVLGLAAKGSKKQTVVTVYTKDGQPAYYLIDKSSHTKVLSEVMPLVRSVGVALHSELKAKQATGEGDMVAQISQLTELKDRGLITEEEFNTKKKQILGL